MDYREWLLTNRLGSYSMGTSVGTLLQPYHAFFVALLRPPLQRRVCVRQLQESVRVHEIWHPLSIQADQPDIFSGPEGYVRVQFNFINQRPVFSYEILDLRLRKQIWMEPDEHAIYVRYDCQETEFGCTLRIAPVIPVKKAFIEQPFELPLFRPIHHGFAFKLDNEDDRWLYFSTDAPANLISVNNWSSFPFAEASLTEPEMNYIPAAIEKTLAPGDHFALRIGLEELAYFDVDLQSEEAVRRQNRLLQHLPSKFADETMKRFILAADQFVIQRATSMSRHARSILSGYPERGDHGWDILFSLPGVLLIPQRFKMAKQVFNMLRQHAASGQMPGRFPRKAGDPKYDRIDAGLLYFIAVYEYWQASRDIAFLEKQYSFLLQLLNSYIDGTENGVAMDPEDGLLFNESESAARTWMDSHWHHWEATPRSGKAIEVQVLWYNVLSVLHEISRVLHKKSGEKKTSELAALVGTSIREQFWLEKEKYLADGVFEQNQDKTFRANQIIALGLPYTPFSEEQTRLVLARADELLVTPFGLRTLSPDHPAYRGRIGQTKEEQAGAWHNGTIHPWLTWPYIRAALRAGYRAEALLNTFEPLFRAIDRGVIGHIPEAYEGDPPYRPVGTPASALSIAAAIQCYAILGNH